MAENLFTLEKMLPYRLNTGSSYTNYGPWVVRNEENARRIGPTPYYKSGTYSYILNNEFEAGKRYVFDMWVDADSVVVDGSNKNAGIIVKYADGTETTMYFKGSQSSPKGFQHKKIVTPEGKTVSGFTVAYASSIGAYYRWDSTITEYEQHSVNKNGDLVDGNLKEGNDPASFSKGGITYCNEIIEM